MISALLLLLVMTSSADQEVTQNLISTVGGEVTIPVPVKSRGFVLKQGRFIASVKDSVLEIENFDFLNRFSWDRASGLFSIRRLQRKDSGDYSVDVNETAVSFKLSVYDAVLKPDVNVTSGSNESCTLLCAVDQLSGGTLSWYQGEVLVNQSSTQRSLPLTVDRLGLRSSYRCVSANPAGNLTRSVEPKTSCPVEQLTGDEEEPIWLFRIVIPIVCGVTFILFLSVIIFYVERHLQASIQQKGGVTQQEELEYGRCNTHVRYNEMQAKEN
ncbi:uncharacterized protein LOC130379825 isoform X8 [Gadus chalcogrammus]|uniref:uncharacterized protein LOC130379825 isoform X8 n=1 Tax=Gadus chalcogrammus TaxID=1042646 RepID=UPI0024C34CE3|nr:uncharacterized protein LOC130379825 isoform X8 [Gadus chalcogrammus]